MRVVARRREFGSATPLDGSTAPGECAEPGVAAFLPGTVAVAALIAPVSAAAAVAATADNDDKSVVEEEAEADAEENEEVVDDKDNDDADEGSEDADVKTLLWTLSGAKQILVILLFRRSCKGTRLMAPVASDSINSLALFCECPAKRKW